jgi:hypothetical protein
MPKKCKNNPKKSYKGTEPSPKGLGWCAGSMNDKTKKKGKDGNMWIIKTLSNGSTRWTKYTTSKTKSKTKSKRKTKSKTKSKTKQSKKNTTYDDSRPAWKKAVGYMLFGKTTYLDPDKPLYIRIAPEYYTIKGEYDTKKFTFTKKNKPSNKDIVKFYKKFMLNKKEGLMDYLDLTHFKLIDVYTVGNKIEYKFKCVSCIDPTNGHILTPNRIPAGEIGFLTWKEFVETLPDGFYKHTTAGDPIKFVKVDKQQVNVRIWGEGAVTTYQK